MHKEFEQRNLQKIRSTYRLIRYAHLQVGVGIHSDIGTFFCVLAAFLSGERTLNESKKEQ